MPNWNSWTMPVTTPTASEISISLPQNLVIRSHVSSPLRCQRVWQYATHAVRPIDIGTMMKWKRVVIPNCSRASSSSVMAANLWTALARAIRPGPRTRCGGPRRFCGGLRRRCARAGAGGGRARETGGRVARASGAGAGAGAWWRRCRRRCAREAGRPPGTRGRRAAARVRDRRGYGRCGKTPCSAITNSSARYGCMLLCGRSPPVKLTAWDASVTLSPGCGDLL